MPDEVAPPLREFGDELMARPGGQWVLATYARYRGAYVGTGAVTA